MITTKNEFAHERLLAEMEDYKCQICLENEGEGYQFYENNKGETINLWVCDRALKIGYCKGVLIK